MRGYLLALPWMLLSVAAAQAAPLGSAFTYQGLLRESGQAASGLYDLQICLFADDMTPVPIACAPDFNDVPVENGIFTVQLDFGMSVFVGELNFLELRVRPGAGGAYAILSPRQALRPTPEALRAGVASASPWSGLTGVPSGFSDNVDDDSGGTVSSIGTGAGLTGGPITSAGSIGVANNGITQSMIAAGAVGSVQLASNAVGLAQIDTAQVQARISGSCAVGEYFRGISAGGAPLCEPLPGLRHTTTVDAGVASVGTFNDIVVLSDGRPAINYYDASNGNLKFAVCANSACTGAAAITTLDNSANDVGQHSSMAIGLDGRPVISYYDATTDDLKVLKCGNETCSSGNSISTVDSTGNVGQLSSIAVGLDGNPVIAYFLYTGTFPFEGDFKVAKCVNPACSGAATITTFDPLGAGDRFSGLSIAVPVDGLPVIAYNTGAISSSGDALWVAKCINAACTGSATRTGVDADVDQTNGAYATLAVGAANLPVIAYLVGTNGHLGFAHCLNASCTSSVREFIAAPNPAYLDIAIGDDAVPVISMHASTSDDLVITRCLTSNCAVVTLAELASHVVVDGNGGPHTSIAIGTDGLPVIAFEDDGGLRVVKCGTRSCQ